jgi:hypothetical protein
MTTPIIRPRELDSLLNRPRYEGKRIDDKRAIRRASFEIRRLKLALQEISDRAGAALSE